MKRRRFPLVAAVGFAAASGLFAASFGEWQVYPGRFTTTAFNEPAWSVHTAGGRVVASRHHLVSSYFSFPAEPSWRNGGGFSYEQRRFAGTGGAVSGKVMGEHLAVPTWPLPAAGALLLAWRLRRWRAAAGPGRCARCGYDLRATPGRCPECGAVPSAQNLA